jgi:hypothetical protein
VLRKYACGPACDAIGYCCQSTTTQCPSCDVGLTRKQDCTCPVDSEVQRRKTPCGPACTALGNCCASKIVASTPAPTTKPTKKNKKCYSVTKARK